MTTVPARATGSRVERQEWAETLLDRLTPVMSALGIIFVLVVVAEQLARSGTSLSTGLAIVGWLLWAVFVVEFVARLVVAPDTGRFWRRNWWQVVFLVLPFLRVLRLVRTVRVLRTGRVLSSTVRGTRSAHSLLGGRLGWLAAVIAITVLGASQLLYQFSDYSHYGGALHDAALAAITGEPLRPDDDVADVLEVVLATFSVVVFGSFAAMLGAYFVQTRTPPATPPGPPPGPGSTLSVEPAARRPVAPSPSRRPR